MHSCDSTEQAILNSCALCVRSKYIGFAEVKTHNYVYKNLSFTLICKYKNANGFFFEPFIVLFWWCNGSWKNLRSYFINECDVFRDIVISMKWIAHTRYNSINDWNVPWKEDEEIKWRLMRNTYDARKIFDFVVVAVVASAAVLRVIFQYKVLCKLLKIQFSILPNVSSWSINESSS